MVHHDGATRGGGVSSPHSRQEVGRKKYEGTSDRMLSCPASQDILPSAQSHLLKFPLTSTHTGEAEEV